MNYYIYTILNTNQKRIIELQDEINLELFGYCYTPMTDEQIDFYLLHRDEYLEGTVSVQEIINCEIHVTPTPYVPSDREQLLIAQEYAYQECKDILKQKQQELSDFSGDDRYEALMNGVLSLLQNNSELSMTQTDIISILSDAVSIINQCKPLYEYVISLIDNAETADDVYQIVEDYRNDDIVIEPIS